MSSNTSGRRGLLNWVVLAVVAIAISGCGGGDPVTMPDVKERRLDVALSDIKRAGFEEDVEILGGGTFGVVNESSWTVCEQDPAVGETVDEAPRLMVDRECPGQTGSDDTESQEQDDSPSEEPASEPADTKVDSGDASATETFVMPALVGQNLQDAQDRLQSLGSYLLTQTDATGMERFQMLDADWKVCGQRPRAGANVSMDKMVELLAVKLDERCR